MLQFLALAGYIFAKSLCSVNLKAGRFIIQSLFFL